MSNSKVSEFRIENWAINQLSKTDNGYHGKEYNVEFHLDKFGVQMVVAVTFTVLENILNG